ncbi:MAG: hypothetical protein H5T68_05930 [Chloroflexi bacterium]|nr:hypothetical protein [Chloroflexota bacterium]
MTSSGGTVILQQKRQTQTADYWLQEFAVHKEDIEYLYDWFVEENEPQNIDALCLKIIEQRCKREEEALSKGSKGAIYQPREKYEVGQRLVFPLFDYATGEVLAVRPGNNPRYGSFSVIQVQLENESTPREFAAELAQDHVLNRSAALLEESTGVLSPEQLYQQYGHIVRERLQEALQQNAEFVHFNGQWFLRGLMPEVTPFHLNIAEAMIDEQRRPLSASQLLQEVELPAEVSDSAKAYALQYALSQDARFVEIGSGEKATWYLANLMPASVLHKPMRLVPLYRTQGGEWLSRELHEFVAEIGDEADQLETMIVAAPSPADSAQILLIYPHRREGTLPLTAQALRLLPEIPAERFMVTFIDQRTGEEIPGWMVPAEKYAWGLEEWYRRHALPIGSVIELRRGNDPFTFLIGYEEGKRRREWIKEAKVFNNRLTFSIQQKAYTCRYDKHLLIDEGSSEELDRLWVNAGDPAPSLFDYLTEIFPELAKLSGQGLVHAKALYSAVNLTRRCGAVPIFAELTRHACFDPVGDGNWVYEESLRDVVYTTPEEMSKRPSSRRQDLIIDRVYPYAASNEGYQP